MSVPGPNAYSRAQRETIINQWTYEEVRAAAEKTVGRATCDRSIFLRRACQYKGMLLELETAFKEGFFDQDIPIASGKYVRSGMANYRMREQMLETMRNQLITLGRFRMGGSA